MKYQFIDNHRSSLRVMKMCQTLKVSRSGYYSWRFRPESQRSKENRILLFHIRVVHDDSRQTYGSPRVTVELKESGLACGENRVARLMRNNGISAKRQRKFRVTTNSKHNYPVAPNLLNRQFEVSRPNAVWVSDITYIWTSNGWLYLAGVVDLHSRMVVGWSMGHRITEQLTLDALNHALTRRQPSSGLLHHSDRGSQYAANKYQTTLKNNGLVPSMSRKGDCWDNAVMESFFATLKTELIYREIFVTREDAKSKIFDYIEMFYNRKRRHSTLGYKSPVEFEMMAEPT
jgi:transposase InsO family protein